MVALALGSDCVSRIQKRGAAQAEALRLAAPCVHAVKGGAANASLCPQCSAELKRAQEKAAAEVRDQKEREAAALARRRSEMLARIRVPEYLTEVDPRAFEKLVCRLYERLGYQVQITRYVGDDGVDGYLRKAGDLIILQCKRTKGCVGAPVLRDLYGAMHHHKATGAIVVTTGKVSKQARSWAKGKPISIVELPELVGLLRQHFREEDVVPEDFDIDAISCARAAEAHSVRSTVARVGSWDVPAIPHAGTRGTIPQGPGAEGVAQPERSSVPSPK